MKIKTNRQALQSPFGSSNASPQKPGLHFSQLKPIVLNTHFLHSPVIESQLPMLLGSILPLHVHSSHEVPAPGSPKNPSAQISHLKKSFRE